MNIYLIQRVLAAPYQPGHQRRDSLHQPTLRNPVYRIVPSLSFRITRPIAITAATMPSIRLDDFSRSGFTGRTLPLMSLLIVMQSAIQRRTGFPP